MVLLTANETQFDHFSGSFSSLSKCLFGYCSFSGGSHMFWCYSTRFLISPLCQGLKREQIQLNPQKFLWKEWSELFHMHSLTSLLTSTLVGLFHKFQIYHSERDQSISLELLCLTANTPYSWLTRVSLNGQRALTASWLNTVIFFSLKFLTNNKNFSHGT